MRLVRATCPFCGKQNQVGFFQEQHVGEPTAMMDVCENFVFFSPTKHPGIHYAKRVLGVDSISAGYSLEAELLRILNQYFKFVGPVAFAPSEEARECARKAVEDFLRARKILASGT